MDMWLIQLQWELGFTGDMFGEIVYEYNDPRVCFKHSEIEFNPELFQKLKDFAIEWWQKHIIEGIVPDPINTNDILTQFPQEEEGKNIEASDALTVTYTEIKQIQETVKDNTEELEKKKFEVQKFMQDAETISYMGEKLFSWKANKNGTRIFRIV